MTIWDKIYKNYQKGGPAWATIDGKILLQFVDFLNSNEFTTKHALEIGCGEGKYLVLLKKMGFLVEGIDSSVTAVKITKDNLKDDSDIRVADMFSYDIPRRKYDLIFSIFSVHHGYKKQIEKVIRDIYSSLLPGGKVFVTLPDYEGSKRWKTFKNNKDLGNGTFAPLSGPEKGLPHSFYIKQEIERLFKNFVNIKIESDEGGEIIQNNWIISGEKIK